MINCNKRQREIHNGQLQHRCIHPEAETKGEVVSENVCEACPLVKLKIKTCKEKRKPVDLVASSDNRIDPMHFPILEDEVGYKTACPYRYPDGDQRICSVTNLPVNPDICERCDAMTKEEAKKDQAKFGTKVLNYFGAIRRWVAQGRPRRTPKEIEEIFENHCKGCEMYDQENHACKSCGCAVSKGSEPLENKLAMATEHCPLGRF